VRCNFGSASTVYDERQAGPHRSLSIVVADPRSAEHGHGRGPLQLKGKAEPVPAWRVIGLYAERSRERALGGLRTPMVGRDRELEHLLDALGAGARRIVVVAPPGVGKTRLLVEHGAEAARRGAAVLRALRRRAPVWPRSVRRSGG
jgi:ATP-dependent Clp protease ATP-binding subunit ClpA